MGLITDNFIYDLVAVAITLLVGWIAISKWRFAYWDRAGLPSIPDPVLLFGNVKAILLGRSSTGEVIREFYREFKSNGYKHGGFYSGSTPTYLPVDPELIKHIMQKDFQHFMNHGGFVNEKNDPLHAHLFNLNDTKWRNMRAKLTPTFTSGKMKMMFQTLADCGVGLQDIMKEAASGHVPVDIKDILARFSTDIIGSCAFGIKCNSLKDPNAEFRKYGRKVFQASFRIRIIHLLLPLVPFPVLRIFKFKITNPEVEAFFMKVIRDTVEYREKNNIYRKDFMHLLLQLKNRGTVTDDENIKDQNESTSEKGLTMNELSAQAFVFFLAGFETSSTTMSFALHELAVNPDIQEKVREEIITVLAKYNDQITYDGIMEMNYLEKVIHETLRKYPPLPMLSRVCGKDYTVPNTNIQLKKGTQVRIPVLALHTDPEYYPDPEKFDPERFTEENKNKRPAFTWLPFGEGPRICIGLRFGMLQSKVGLTALLKNYKIKLSKKTHQHPMKVDPRSCMTRAAGGIWLDVEKIE